MANWHLITGEYPPQPGGVADYTRLVAQGLADVGDKVHVWTQTAEGVPYDDRGVTVHFLPDCFGPRFTGSTPCRLKAYRATGSCPGPICAARLWLESDEPSPVSLVNRLSAEAVRGHVS